MEAAYLWSHFLQMVHREADEGMRHDEVLVANPKEFFATLNALIAQAGAPLLEISESRYRANNRHHAAMLSAVSVNLSGDLYDMLDHMLRRYLSYELLFGWPSAPTPTQSGSSGSAAHRSSHQAHGSASQNSVSPPSQGNSASMPAVSKTHTPAHPLDGEGSIAFGDDHRTFNEANVKLMQSVGSEHNNLVHQSLVNSGEATDDEDPNALHRPAHTPSQALGQLFWMLPSPQSPGERGLLRVEVAHSPRGVLEASATIMEDAMRLAKHYIAWSDKRFDEEDSEFNRRCSAAQRQSQRQGPGLPTSSTETLVHYTFPRVRIRKKFVLILGGDPAGGDNKMRQWRDVPVDASDRLARSASDNKSIHRSVLVETRGRARYQVRPVTEWVRKSTYADKLRRNEPTNMEEDVWVLQAMDVDAENTCAMITNVVKTYVSQVGQTLSQQRAQKESKHKDPHPPSGERASHPAAADATRRVCCSPNDEVFSPTGDTRIVVQVIVAADFGHWTVKTPTALAAFRDSFLPRMARIYQEMVDREAALFPAFVSQVLFRVEVVCMNAPVVLTSPEALPPYDACATLARELFLTVRYPWFTAVFDLPATTFFCGIEVPMWGTSSRDIEGVNLLFARVAQGRADTANDAARIVIHRGMDVSKDDHVPSTVADRHTESVTLNNLMFHFWAVAPTSFRRRLARGLTRSGGAGTSAPLVPLSTTVAASVMGSSPHLLPMIGGPIDADEAGPNRKAAALAKALTAYDPETESTILRGYRIYRSIIHGVGHLLAEFSAAMQHVLPPPPSMRNPQIPSTVAPRRALPDLIVVTRCDPALAELDVTLTVTGRRMAVASSTELVWGLMRAAFNTVGIHVYLTTRSADEIETPAAGNSSGTATVSPTQHRSGSKEREPAAKRHSTTSPTTTATVTTASNHTSSPREGHATAPLPLANGTVPQPLQTVYRLHLHTQPLKHFRHATVLNATAYVGPLLANALFPIWDLCVNLRVRLAQNVRESAKLATRELRRTHSLLASSMQRSVTSAPHSAATAAASGADGAGDAAGLDASNGGGVSKDTAIVTPLQPPATPEGPRPESAQDLPPAMTADDGPSAVSPSLPALVLLPIGIAGDYDDDAEFMEVAPSAWLGRLGQNDGDRSYHPTRGYNRRMGRRGACSVYVPLLRVLVAPRTALALAMPPGAAPPTNGEDFVAQASLTAGAARALEQIQGALAALLSEPTSVGAQEPPPLASMLVARVVGLERSMAATPTAEAAASVVVPVTELGLVVDFNEIQQYFNCSSVFVAGQPAFSHSTTAADLTAWVRRCAEAVAASDIFRALEADARLAAVALDPFDGDITASEAGDVRTGDGGSVFGRSAHVPQSPSSHPTAAMPAPPQTMASMWETLEQHNGSGSGSGTNPSEPTTHIAT